MKPIFFILKYALPRLKKYWVRFALGIFLGLLFGLVNGALFGLANVVFHRLSDPIASVTPPPIFSQIGWVATVEQTFYQIKQSLFQFIDPVLPVPGHSLNWMQTIVFVSLFPLAIGLRGALGYFSIYFIRWANERMARDLRCEVVGKLNTLSIDYFNQSTLADMMTRVYGDTQMLLTAMSLGLSDLIKEPITIFSIACALAIIDWRLALLALLFIPFCLYPITVLGKKVRQASKKSVEISIDASNVLIDAFRNVRVVKAFTLEEKQNEEFRSVADRIVHVTMKSIRASEMLNPAIEILAGVTLGIIILYIFISNVALADLMTFLVAAALLPNSVKKLANIHNSFQKARIGVERMENLMALRPTVDNRPEAIPLTTFTQGISFEHLRFAYGEKEVLKDLTLTLPKGHKLGIAGPTGSGKSTLINLMLRFYDPTHGRVLMDGCDIRDVTLDSLRAHMALVSQEVLLFNRSVADNIALGKQGATRGEVEEAAKRASAHEFISAMPQGYDTMIGEAGIRISGGQRQRLAIARAFIRNAPILLLDEATAALDAQTESDIQKSLEKLAADRTVICVAHRLSTLTWCDEIIFLDGGVIVEQGSFASLINKRGRFFEMANAQGLS